MVVDSYEKVLEIGHHFWKSSVSKNWSSKISKYSPTGSASTQTVFSKLALRDRNVQVRFFWKVVLKFWDLRNFTSATSFYEIYAVCHLRSNLQTCEKKMWKNILNVTTVNFSSLRILKPPSKKMFLSLSPNKKTRLPWLTL